MLKYVKTIKVSKSVLIFYCVKFCFSVYHKSYSEVVIQNVEPSLKNLSVLFYSVHQIDYIVDCKTV